MDKIWLKSYPPGVPAEIDPDQYGSLVQLLEECVPEVRREQCLCLHGQVHHLRRARQHVARAWPPGCRAAAWRKGARVAVMMPNVLQYPVAMAAILRAGYVVVNVNPLYTPRELEHQLKDSGARGHHRARELRAPRCEQVLAQDRRCKHVVVASMGDLLGGLKGMLVEFRRAQASRRWCRTSRCRARCASSDALAQGAQHAVQAGRS